MDFQTKKDPAYRGKLTKVLVVSQNADLALKLEKGFISRMLTRLTAALALKNVPVEVVQMNQSDLDPNSAVRTAAERFRPEELLYIALTRVNTQTVTRGNPGLPSTSAYIPQGPMVMVDSITISYSLQDRQSGKMVWRGEALFDPPPHPEDIADRLLKQLEAEDFF